MSKRKRRRRGEPNKEIILAWCDNADPSTFKIKHKGGRPIVLEFDKKLTMDEVDDMTACFSEGYTRAEFKEDHPELTSHCISWRRALKSENMD